MNRLAMPVPAVRVALACVALTITSACHQAAKPASEAPLAGAAIGGPFTLTSATGKTVHWSDFAGRYRIVYFGYTYCPDACPTDVQRFSLGLRQFTAAHPQLGAQIQPLFISVDPARDTPAKLAEFTAAFDPRLIGLTGTPAQVKQAADAFKIYYELGPKQKDGSYTVNHSTTTYLFGRNGEPLAILPTDVDDGGKSIAAELAKWVS